MLFDKMVKCDTVNQRIQNGFTNNLGASFFTMPMIPQELIQEDGFLCPIAVL